MKLYYSPGTCALSPHISLYESGLPFEAVLASTKTHRLADGTDYYSLNPKGYVPMLELDDGTRLTEGPVIVQWIADQVPDKQLAPPAGTMERYRLQEWLVFISTEIHKQFSPLFNPAMPEDAKAIFRQKILARLGFVNQHLGDDDYLLGERFSVADGYLFAVSRWTVPMKIDISELDKLAGFMERMAARPAVKQAMKAEGLTD